MHWAGFGIVASARFVMGCVMATKLIHEGWGVIRDRCVSKGFWFGVAVTLLLLGSMWMRVDFAQRASPYCRHVDESIWTPRSITMLKTGDLNPHRFVKPSVMVYLNTAGMALGLVRAGAHRDPIYRPADLGRGGYPYYDSPTTISTVRTIYSALSVLAMLMGALCVRKLTRSGGVALLALFLMASSAQYFLYSWNYLNVDILGVFFAVTAISYALLHAPSTPPTVVSVITGVLAGLTLGTKYNLFWIAVPMLIVVLSASKNYRVERTVLFVVSMVVTFLITTPYAVLDAHQFVTDVAFEAHHYASGHKSEIVKGRIPMLLKHLSHLTDHISPILLLAALVGVVRLFACNQRGALIVLSYPALLFLYMTQQRTFFPRNILIFHLFVPMLAAVGLSVVFVPLKERVRRMKSMSANLASMLSAAVLTILILLTTPWTNVAQAFDPQVESRNEVVEWAFEHIPAKSRILIAKQLDFDARPLEKRYSIATYDVNNTSLSQLRERYPGAFALIPKIKAGRAKVSPSNVDVMAEFGKNLVSLKSRYKAQVVYVAWGNPAFVVAKL